MRLLLIIALVAVAAAAFIMLARPSGPRVTRIEHRRDEADGDDDA